MDVFQTISSVLLRWKSTTKMSRTMVLKNFLHTEGVLSRLQSYSLCRGVLKTGSHCT